MTGSAGKPAGGYFPTFHRRRPAVADRETARLEAAAIDWWTRKYEGGGWPRANPWNREHARKEVRAVLSAADDWDRANGFVTVRLGDELTEGLARALRPWAEPGEPPFVIADQVATVVAVLREAAERDNGCTDAERCGCELDGFRLNTPRATER